MNEERKEPNASEVSSGTVNMVFPLFSARILKRLPTTFNARAETVAENPMFTVSFKRRRCPIPASGYYEWHTTAEGKQRYYFTPPKGSILARRRSTRQEKKRNGGSKSRFGLGPE